jgi:hypothetical protein
MVECITIVNTKREVAMARCELEVESVTMQTL